MAELEAQGFLDAFKLLDKDLINKVLAITKAIKVEKIDGVVRITIELVEQKT